MYSLILIGTIVMSLYPELSYAHSGRTDSSGGHNCSQKSINKGLCTGYHSHNSGTSSSTSSSSSSPSTSQQHDKDCSDFSSYDEVVAYWNAKGYTKEYDPERLDGFGNVVDDGIPCEAPGSYDLTKINHSQAQQDENDRTTGEQDGYHAGQEAGYAGTSSKDVEFSTDGSDAYKSGYTTGYENGYAEGQEKLDQEKQSANQEGYNDGLNGEELDVSNQYSNHEELFRAYESGYGQAVEELAVKREQEAYETGLKDGRNDQEEKSQVYQEERYEEAYRKGLKEGRAELKNTYSSLGYEAAFNELKANPSYEKEHYNDWFKEGFGENLDREREADAAYEQGLIGEEYNRADDVQISKEMYSHYYDKGRAIYEEKQRENTRNTSLFIGTAMTGWLGRRFYVAKKMVR